LRYALEQARITQWLEDVGEAAQQDQAVALEVVALQQLVKGYGETHARGLANFRILMGWWREAQDAAAIRNMREAALADDDGTTLAAALRDDAKVSRAIGTRR
jgi:indolepyruvate ferredoxin oxidoreductase beta subunit